MFKSTHTHAIKIFLFIYICKLYRVAPHIHNNFIKEQNFPIHFHVYMFLESQVSVYCYVYYASIIFHPSL